MGTNFTRRRGQNNWYKKWSAFDKARGKAEVWLEAFADVIMQPWFEKWDLLLVCKTLDLSHRSELPIFLTASHNYNIRVSPPRQILCVSVHNQAVPNSTLLTRNCAAPPRETHPNTTCVSSIQRRPRAIREIGTTRRRPVPTIPRIPAAPPALRGSQKHRSGRVATTRWKRGGRARLSTRTARDRESRGESSTGSP